MSKTEFNTDRDWAALAQKGIKMNIPEGYVYVGKGNENSGLPFSGTLGRTWKFENESWEIESWLVGDNENYDYFTTVEKWEEITGLNYKQVTKKEMEYPIYAKYKQSPFIVKFTDKTTGIVVEDETSEYYIGHSSDCWYSWDNTSRWEILPDYQENAEPGIKAAMDRQLPNCFCIKVKSPIQSAAIQEHLFGLGYSWSPGKTAQYTDAPYLFGNHVEGHKFLGHDDIKGNEATEITLAELFSFEPDVIKEIPIKFGGYEGKITPEKITMGCQEMKIEDLKRLKEETDDYRAGLHFFDMLHDKYNSFSNIHVDIEGLTFVTGSEKNKMTFAEFDAIVSQIK